jgi:hypothetical protein
MIVREEDKALSQASLYYLVPPFRALYHPFGSSPNLS